MPIYRIAPILAGIVLIAAAVLKYRAGPVEGYGLLAHQSIVAAESCIGILLLAGIGGRWMLRFSAIAFAAFAIIAGLKFVRGESSCGCFGTLAVPPGTTMLVDLALAVSLSMSSKNWKRGKRQAMTYEENTWDVNRTTHHSSFTTLRFLRPIFAVSIVIASATIVFWPARPVQSEGFNPNSLGIVSGNLIVLEAEKWVGESVPFADLLEGGSVLLQGDWVILIVHDGCSTCEEAIPLYSAINSWGRNGVPRIAVIEIPPSTKLQDYTWAGFVGILPEKWDWFATTPVAVSVHNGVVTATTFGETASDPNAILRTP